MLAIYTALLFLFLLGPTLLVGSLSFTDSFFMTFPPPGWTLDWYGELWSDPRWREPLMFSVLLAVVTATFTVILASLAAWRVYRSVSRLGRILQALALAPLAVPPIALATGSFLVWARVGALGSPIALIATHAMLAAPFAFVVVGLAISRLDDAQLHAARVLGASNFHVVRSVVIPQVLPSLAAAWVFALVISLDEVVITRFLLSAGQIPTLAVFIFRQITDSQSPVIAVAAVLYTFVAVLAAIGMAARSDAGRPNGAQ